ncbi:hypothetical protein [Bacillus paranthracis]|uniref:hypothetical protein n=1 Tax=Bacillus paranthracis TaxID=2026186 RepID=UPI000B12440D|nr:hypothetical protein [Bacillus paranthracis]MCC2439546.1 hypothetical protein [Bacillus paranthracis]MDG1606343.1 hypothetical protein [Bacillus paranthracis]
MRPLFLFYFNLSEVLYKENEKQRALLFDLSKGFTAIPTTVMRHYTYLPGFNGNVVLMYGYIIAMYNP